MIIKLITIPVLICMLNVFNCFNLVESNVSTNLDYTNIVNKLQPFTDYHISKPRLATLSQNTTGDVNNFPSIIHLNTNIYGNRIDSDLHMVNALYSSNTRVQIFDKENSLKKIEPENLRSYYTKLEKFNGWCSVTFHDDSTFRGVFYLNSELYQVDLSSDVISNITSKKQFATLSQSGMTITKTKDVTFSNNTCGSTLKALPKMTVHDTEIHTTTSNSQMATLINRWSNCYPGDDVPNQISIGVAVDAGFYQSFGNEMVLRSYIANMFATMNAITLQQFNVYFTVVDIVIYTEVGSNTPVWNRKPGSVAKCGTTIDQTLNEFSAWRNSAQKNKNSLWTLLTNCFPSPGTIGLSWINTLCDTYYSTSVVSKTATTWLTGLHEIGHTLAAQHTFQLGQGKTGSIMDYGNNAFKGDIQFADIYTKSQICGSFTRAKTVKNITPFCMAPYSVKCGNGIVEQGEECDDTTSCCVNCKLAPNTQCSGNSGCCSDSCKFLPTITTCGKTGYCSNGMCSESMCSKYSGLTFCGVNPSNTCRQQCQSGTSCSDKYSVPNLAIADGITCSYNNVLSTCKNGVCQTPVNVTPTNTVPTSVVKTQMLPSVDISGQDIKNAVVSETDCVKSLISDSSISFAVYKKDSGTCYLKSSGTNSGVYDNTLNLYVKLGQNLQISNVDFYGNDYTNYASNDLVKCRNDCVSNLSCLGTEYYQNRCYFKNKLENTRNLVNGIFLLN